MAAAALLTFVSPRNPNPNLNPKRYGTKSPVVLVRLSSSSYSQFQALPAARLDLTRIFVLKRCLGAGIITFDRRIQRLVPLAASQEESKHFDIEVEKEKNELERGSNESQEAWKQTLESFKEEAKKMKEMSQEAYEVYSKKAMVKLKEMSETLKIQADKAKHDLSIIAKEINREGKVYLSTAAENSPDSVKDIVETFSSTDELKEMAAVRDFYLGIPYGAFLAIRGFLSFMLTGSIPAIRFGVILGSALLALSISSLRSWKSGQSSELFLKGQAAIAAIIFIRECRFFCQRQSFSTLLMILISGAMVAFYVYRIIINGSSKGPRSEHSSEN